MTRIKVLTNFQKRAGGMEGVEACPGYFFTQDPACEDYDWLVVFDELPMDRVEVRCPRERTILCTWEPVSIKSYSRAYTRQFGHLLTNRPPEAERHPHYHLGRGYFLPFVLDIPMPIGSALPLKRETISTVCSSKQMRHTMHYARYRLVSELAKVIPTFSWYGHGVRPLEHKSDALIPYRYHVVVENHIAVNHWTEKISDALLCECLPFYAGDPELGKVLPPESFIPIPIDDPVEASRIIKEAIAAGEFERRREAILEAKRLIVKKYNFWMQVVELIRSESAQRVTPSAPFPIYGRRTLRKVSPLAALEDVWLHLKRGFR